MEQQGPMVVVLSPIYLLDFTSGPKPRLVAWWKMDEGNGTKTSGGLVPDSPGRPQACLI